METILGFLSLIFLISAGIFLWRLLFRRHLPKTKWFIIAVITLFTVGYFEEEYEKKEIIAKKIVEEELIENKDNWLTYEEARAELSQASSTLELEEDNIFKQIKSVSNYKNQIISFFKNEIPYYQIYKSNGLILDTSTDKPANGVVTLRGGDGKIYYQQEVENGKKNGKYVEYYPNHNLKVEGQSIEEIKFGSWKTFYDNKKNQLHTNYSYQNGKRSGSFKNYYENGQVEVNGEYLDGFRIGKWEYFYSNGNLESKGEFKNGKHEGKWRTYHPNGKLNGVGKMSDDNKIETWKYYYSNGDLQEEVRYTFLGVRLKY
ncbi:toxin-antitoxin system YwqK family antitoxin [Cetobacterium sp.]|uniref:toxin-antitoxin system YwqK family antitoxin n=1 Tax=Cetobacterium sp. TaxID=2071632 RepID=UPI003F35D03A